VAAWAAASDGDVRDVPVIDPAGFRLVVDGLVDTPLSLDLDAIRRRPRVSAVVTLECAGNGRAGLLPRPVSQPWLVEAVGTARWTGTPLAPLLREAGVRDGAVGSGAARGAVVQECRVVQPAGGVEKTNAIESRGDVQAPPSAVVDPVPRLCRLIAVPPAGRRASALRSGAKL